MSNNEALTVRQENNSAKIRFINIQVKEGKAFSKNLSSRLAGDFTLLITDNFDRLHHKL